MAAPARLLGRDGETAIIEAAIDETMSSRAAIVVLEGEGGIGKSRLLAEACDHARRRGMQVAVGRAEELEQSRPFGLMARVLGCHSSSPDPRRAEIAGLLAPQQHGGDRPITVSSDPGLQFRVVDAMTDLVEALISSVPLLIGVDDLQWADHPSLLTLAALSRLPDYLPVVLVVCLRPVPRSQDLTRLLGLLMGAEHTRYVRLRGLDPAAVTAMVAESTAADPGPRLLAAVARARGNPLFVNELLTALDEEGTLEIVDGRCEVSEPALSPTLRLTILRRLTFLSDDALAVLRAASILGSTFTLSDLATTTARSAYDLSLVLTEALAARVVEDDDDRLRFRHDLIRDAIYEDLPLSVRRGLHREAGDRLAKAGARVSQVAEHFSRGAMPGDKAAIEWITRAARAAATRSPSLAVSLLERAVGLMDNGGIGRDQVRLELASCLLLSGRIVEAAQVCRDLLDARRDDGVQAPARICLGHALIASGRAGEALTELLRAGEGSTTAGEQISARAWGSLASFWTGDLMMAAELAAGAAQGATEVGDPLSSSVALAVHACVRQLQARLAEALEEIDIAIDRAERSPARAGHRYPLHLSRGHFLMDLDRLDEARIALGIGRRTSAEFGLRWAIASHHMVGGRALFLAGEWDDAVVEFEAGFDLAEETGESLNMFIGRAVVAMISLHRNDLRVAQEAASAARHILERRPGSPYRGPWAVWAQALVSEAHHDSAAALGGLAGCWDDCTAHGLLLDLPVIGPDLVRMAVAEGDIARARDVCRGVDDVAAMNTVPSFDGAALRCHGLAEDDPDLLLAAVDAYARGPRVLDTALAREETGDAMLRRNQVDRGCTFLVDALLTYEHLNASRDVMRVEASLRGAGVRRGRRGTRKRPQHGWLSLTPTEQTIARLVADGLSNPQIADSLYVSYRTVQTHVSHIFAKLDINSRVQLAAEIARRQGADQATSPRR